MSEIVKPTPDDVQGNGEKLKPTLTVFRRSVDRLTYTGSERWRILNLPRSSPRFGCTTDLRTCSLYYPAIFNTGDSFEIHYSVFPSGVILLPGDKPSYIRDVFESLRSCFADQREIERLLDLVSKTNPVAISNGLVRVVHPITLEKTAITSLVPDSLPPSSIMIARNHHPLSTRLQIGNTAVGNLFEAETYYNPEVDQFRNVLSGLVTRKYE